MNRSTIKLNARKLISNNKWIIWKPQLIILLLSMAVDTFLISGLDLNEEIVSSLTAILLSPALVGMIKYYLNFVRGEKYDIIMILDGYKKFLPYVGAAILTTIMVSAGTILFIIPGIILALALSMVNYIFADGENDPIESIKKSFKMMKGYKTDYFVFILSFIGWLLLGLITLGIAFIWVYPYIAISCVLYYEELKSKK